MIVRGKIACVQDDLPVRPAVSQFGETRFPAR